MAYPSLYHWNGMAMERLDTSSLTINLYAMWGTDSSNLWLVGAGASNQVVKYDGFTFTVVLDSASQSWFTTPYVIFGTSVNDIWVGGDQCIAHWDGAAWTQVIDPIGEVPVAWYGISGFASNDIYLCGYGTKDYEAYNRYILHWNGVNLTQSYREVSAGYTAFNSIRKLRT